MMFQKHHLLPKVSSWALIKKRLGKCLKCSRIAVFEEWRFVGFGLQCVQCEWILEAWGAFEFKDARGDEGV